MTEGRLPDFFVIGAQKSGTSTLHRLLQQHPQAFLCDPKEPHYFSDPAVYARGESEYRMLFGGAGDALAVGEASTTYSMYPHYSGVVERVAKAVPNPRLIYLVREPIARMRSAYLHALTWGSEIRPIAEALRSDPRYLLHSSYAFQLEQWLELVPRDRILLLSLDELHADPGNTLARAAAFLCLDPGWRPPVVAPANVSEGKRPPRAWWRALGEVTLRSGNADRVPRWMSRLNDSGSPLVRRAVDAAELDLPSDIADELRRALREDHRRLAAMWTVGSTPTWLETESSTASET